MNRHLRRILLASVLTTAVSLMIFAASPTAQACPMCSESLPNNGADSTAAGPADNSLAAGFYYSILLMLAVPASIASGFGIVLYRATHKTATT